MWCFGVCLVDFGFGVVVVCRGLIVCERWVSLIGWVDVVQVVVWVFLVGGCLWLSVFGVFEFSVLGRFIV